MYFNQSDKFEQLKKKILGISFNLPEGEEFTFHDLNSRGKDTHGHLVYLKTGPNPHYNSNTSKGGDC